MSHRKAPHLPIWRDAQRFLACAENAVRRFAQYRKYTAGTQQCALPVVEEAQAHGFFAPPARSPKTGSLPQLPAGNKAPWRRA
jgi:hypothetical protein